MFDTQIFQSLTENQPNPETMDTSGSVFDSAAFIIIIIAVIAVVFSVMFAVLINVISHELFMRPSEMEADLELGEQRPAVVQSDVTGWLAETGAGEPLPGYVLEDPLGEPPAFDVVCDLGVFVVESDGE
jgi:hypothetical protein